MSRSIHSEIIKRMIEDCQNRYDSLEEAIQYVNNTTKIHNCKNCGAPLTSYKCEYCGTSYM